MTTTSSARPVAGSHAAHVHRTAHTLRTLTADGRPTEVLRVARHLDADTARGVAAILALSEQWSWEDRAAMDVPLPAPGPDRDAIKAENAAIRRRASLLEELTTDYRGEAA